METAKKAVFLREMELQGKCIISVHTYILVVCMSTKATQLFGTLQKASISK